MAKLPKELEGSMAESEDALAALLLLFDRRILEFLHELEVYIVSLISDSPRSRLRVVDSGQLAKDADNLQRAMNARTAIITFARKEFGDFADDWIRQFDKLADFTIENLKHAKIPAIMTEIDAGILDAIKQRVTSRFNTGTDIVFQELTGDIIREVVVGGNSKNLLGKIKSRLLSAPIIGEAIPVGQSLEAVVKRLGHDSIMEVYRTLHARKADEAGSKIFLYHGQIVQNTRKFCAARKGKSFSLEVIKSWNALSWQGKIPGVDILIALGGYGCIDHLQAVPISMENAVRHFEQIKAQEAAEQAA